MQPIRSSDCLCPTVCMSAVCVCQQFVCQQFTNFITALLYIIVDESGMPPSFWGEALSSFIHVHNRVTTTSVLPESTPYEAFLGSKPDISMLQVWGCTAYVLIRKDKRPLGSLGSHMEKCIFIGYPQGYKAWKFYSPRSKKVFISERADFDEHFFINQKHSTPQLPPPRPNSLLEPSPPSAHLPDTFMDALDDPGHSQQPVHGGDEFTPSV
jgi:hypothetical protein